MRLATFLGPTYIAGELATLCRTSPIVMYIMVGALLGPPLADFAPIPTGLMLAGLLGIQLSVLHAGVSTRLSDLKHSAIRATIVAVLGVIFPIAGTCIVVCVSDVIAGTFDTSRSLKAAFASGAAIAPTSLGVTARLLEEAGELHTHLGRLISIAAVVDDVISLVLLAQVLAVAAEHPGVWDLLNPVVYSALFIGGALAVAVVLPAVISFVVLKLKLPSSWLPALGLSLLLATATVMAYVATLANTSFLLAGYMTGVAFAHLPAHMAVDPWNKHVAIYINWLSLLFFAATIGFVIPLKDLFAASSLGTGALLAVVGVVGKMFCGLALLPNAVDALAVAVAMLGRGDFGFLIAVQARAAGLLSPHVYAATTWGVLVPTVLAPLVFAPVFRWRNRIHARQSQGSDVSSSSTNDI